MSFVRVIKTAPATLARTFYLDETPTNASGAVTVTVTRLDGTAVTSGPATNVGTGIYTYVLPGQPLVDHLDVTWSGTFGGSVVSLADRVEIVGGYLFGLAEARNSDTALTSTTTYPTSMLATKRIEVEQECERLTGRSFVPRFRRILLNGSGRCELVTPDHDLRRIRAASLAWVTGDALVALTGSELSSIVATAEGTLVRPAGIPWPLGLGNVIVEYEYGCDLPTSDLADAAMIRLRSRLNMHRSGIPDRTSSYTDSNGATYRVIRPTRGTTGLDEVDAVYARYEAPAAGFA